MYQRLLSTSLAIAAIALVTATGFRATASEVMTKGAELGKWTQDYDAALKLAAEKKLPLFLNFTGSDWCIWCKRMDKSVFADAKWPAYAKDHLVLVTIDFPQDKTLVPDDYKERNDKLQQQYGIEGYPTYVIVDSDGKTELGRLGAGRDVTFDAFKKQVEEVTRYTDGAIDAFCKSLDADTAAAYRKAIADSRDAKKALDTWLATRPEKNDANDMKFQEMRDKILATETAVRRIEIKQRATTMPAEKAAEYTAAYENLLKANQELLTWMSTQPEPTDENKAKFKQLQETIVKYQEQVDSFE